MTLALNSRRRSRAVRQSFRVRLAVAGALAAAMLAPAHAWAFGACQAFAGREQAKIVPVRYADPLPAETLAISYVTHSTFLIQTPGGAEVATDFAGYIGPGKQPRAVTMNNAHSTHYTSLPDPSIEHVLRGWPESGKKRREHRVEFEDLRIRNVHTDVISYGGGTRENGNSIFIFELGDLCVAHLGHLHHVPTEAQYAEIGFVDVVMAPVDGGLTLRHEDMIAVLNRLEARLVLPMHYFGSATLERFLTNLSSDFEVQLSERGSVLVSKATLPRKPTLLVLPPRFVNEYE